MVNHFLPSYKLCYMNLFSIFLFLPHLLFVQAVLAFPEITRPTTFKAFYNPRRIYPVNIIIIVILDFAFSLAPWTIEGGQFTDVGRAFFRFGHPSTASYSSMTYNLIYMKAVFPSLKYFQRMGLAFSFVFLVHRPKSPPGLMRNNVTTPRRSYHLGPTNIFFHRMDNMLFPHAGPFPITRLI